MENNMVEEIPNTDIEDESFEENKERKKGKDAGRTLTIRVSKSALLHARRNDPLAVFSKIIRKGIHTIPQHLLEEYDNDFELKDTLEELNQLTKRINTKVKQEERHKFTDEELKIILKISNSKIERFIKDKHKLPKNDQNERIKIRINQEEKEILRKLKKHNRLFFQDVANAILLDFNFDNLRNYDHQRNIDRSYSIASRNIEQIISNIDTLDNKEKGKNIIKEYLGNAFERLNKISEEK